MTKAQSDKVRNKEYSDHSVPLCLCASVPVRNGFTLIELLTVIVVMAMIITIAAPAFIGIGRGAGMRGAVSGTKSTLSLLRQWAITHREEVTFTAVNNDPLPSYYFATNSVAMIVSNDLPLEVVFDNSSETPFTFKTDGGLTSGSITKHIYIRDRKVSSDTKTISVNGITGGIRVE